MEKQIFVKIKIPETPNYILLYDPMNSEAKLAVEDFSEKELKEIGRLWTLELVKKKMQKKRQQTKQ